MNVEIQIPKPETVSVDKLQVDGQNPNKMTLGQLERLKTSIQKYGFIVPIVTNREYLIADGEQRLEAAKALGMQSVLVVKLDVEDVDRRLLRQVFRHQHELIIWARNKHYKRDKTKHNLSDVLEAKRTPSQQREHPVEKPVDLLKQLFTPLTNDSDILVDLFVGGGGLVIACEQTGRTCYMMEIDPRYCQVIIDRWGAYTKQKAVKVD